MAGTFRWDGSAKEGMRNYFQLRRVGVLWRQRGDCQNPGDCRWGRSAWSQFDTPGSCRLILDLAGYTADKPLQLPRSPSFGGLIFYWPQSSARLMKKAGTILVKVRK